VYVRVLKTELLVTRERHTFFDGAPFFKWPYEEWHPERRLITSRRVERAVETDDFLRLCAEEGLMVQVTRGRWYVHPFYYTFTYANELGEAGEGATLREAYYRYHAAADAS